LSHFTSGPLKAFSSLPGRTGGFPQSFINGQSVVSAMKGEGGSDRVIEMWKEFDKAEKSTLVVERGNNALTLKKAAQ
jgi:hypothetical protein